MSKILLLEMGTQLELAEESEEDESGDEEDEWDSQDEDTGLILMLIKIITLLMT